MEPSTERLTRNQARFREVNERVNQLRPATLSFREFICECSDPSCSKSLFVAAGEYDAVRAHPTRFLVAHGHDVPDVERVVFDNDRFSVVETTVETGLLAESDPRSSARGNRHEEQESQAGREPRHVT